jgi:hypothetical protein
MPRCSKFLTLLLLLSPAVGFSREVPKGDSPSVLFICHRKTH